MAAVSSIPPDAAPTGQTGPPAVPPAPPANCEMFAEQPLTTTPTASAASVARHDEPFIANEVVANAAFTKLVEANRNAKIPPFGRIDPAGSGMPPNTP